MAKVKITDGIDHVVFRAPVHKDLVFWYHAGTAPEMNVYTHEITKQATEAKCVKFQNGLLTVNAEDEDASSILYMLIQTPFYGGNYFIEKEKAEGQDEEFDGRVFKYRVERNAYMIEKSNRLGVPVANKPTKKAKPKSKKKREKSDADNAT